MDSSVLIVGAGGLGSPVALYLGAAGVGRIGIVDFDQVDLSNLQRQILHTSCDVGRPKVESAVERLAMLNPDVKVIPHAEPLSSANALALLSQYDLVVNGSDNFPTRYLVNDACVFSNKPLVDGSVLRFEGHVTVFLPGRGCYRCLFPAPPPPGLMPNCQEAGVLGVLCGVIGSLQGLEALKLLLGIGEPLAGRLLWIDGLSLEIRSLKVRRDPTCPVCGDRPTITDWLTTRTSAASPSLSHILFTSPLDVSLTPWSDTHSCRGKKRADQGPRANQSVRELREGRRLARDDPLSITLTSIGFARDRGGRKRSTPSWRWREQPSARVTRSGSLSWGMASSTSRRTRPIPGPKISEAHRGWGQGGLLRQQHDGPRDRQGSAHRRGPLRQPV